MSEENKAIVTRFLTALSAGDVETMKPMMATDIEAVAMGTGTICGTRRYEDIVKVGAAFPLITESGLNPRILSLTAEDDRVVVEWEGNATLTNGQQYNNQYAMIFFVRDGKVCKLKEYFCTKLADEVLVPLLYPVASGTAIGASTEL